MRLSTLYHNGDVLLLSLFILCLIRPCIHTSTRRGGGSFREQIADCRDRIDWILTKPRIFLIVICTSSEFLFKLYFPESSRSVAAESE
jgi:hypothetical protein